MCDNTNFRQFFIRNASEYCSDMKKDLKFLRLKMLSLLILGVALWLLALMAPVLIIAVLYYYDHRFLPFLSAIFLSRFDV